MKNTSQKSAYLITIGDELLIGQVIDTNSAWIADQLTVLNISVKKILSIQDNEKEIIEALEEASKKSDIVILTGGLGPTIDDITKRTIAKFLGVEMQFNPEFYQEVKAYVEKRGAKLDDLMYNYSFFPKGIRFLNNTVGTAPGMEFRYNDSIFFSMPGVPAEMKAIFIEEILPGLKNMDTESFIIKKTILTAGEMEAVLAERLKLIVSEMPDKMSVAYLPNLGRVRIRITTMGERKKEAQALNDIFIDKIKLELGDIIYGYDDDIFEDVIGKLLKKNGLILGTAESCTGGMIANKIISVSGSSEYFNGSIVAYANKIKMGLLGVSPYALKSHGAVSEETVTQMVKGALDALKCDVAIASSGIAGPTGGTYEKPVGTIWIACGNKRKVLAQKLQLGENRMKNIETSTILALNLMRRFLLDQ
jgi:nicotinamide-nucleotide amidase